MNVVPFHHSLVSDWNNGHAHFLRGIAGELVHRTHCVQVFEPQANWRFTNLLREHGPDHLWNSRARYPDLRCDPCKSRNIDTIYRPKRPRTPMNSIDCVWVGNWGDEEGLFRPGKDLLW